MAYQPKQGDIIVIDFGIIARNVSYKESITEDLLDETIDLICSFVE